MPLIDGNGSTVAMVDAASGNMTTQYTYDPLGGVQISGGGYQTVFQYLGMENDGWSYYGGHRYYSPTMDRFLSLQGPLSAAGGAGSGLPRGVSAAIPGASSAGPTAGAALGAFSDAADAFAGTTAALAGVDSALGALAASVAPYAAPVAAGLEIADQMLNFFGVFGGGGPSLPPWTIYKLTHPGGNLQMFQAIEGVYRGLVTTERSLAGVQPVAQMQGGPQRPLAKTMTAGRQGPSFLPLPNPDCMLKNLGTGEGSTVPPICVGGALICLFTGAPPACIAGYAACSYGIGVEAYCSGLLPRRALPPKPPVPPLP